jgi:hypothetical protein
LRRASRRAFSSGDPDTTPGSPRLYQPEPSHTTSSFSPFFRYGVMS